MNLGLKFSTIFWTFLWSIFMGITAISIGFGAAIPSLNLVSKPFVCPNGEMQLTTKDYHPSPVETVTTLTWYCVDKTTGAQTEISMWPMALSAGTIYGLLLFLVILLGMVISGMRKSVTQSTSGPFATYAATSSKWPDRTGDPELDELVQLEKQERATGSTAARMKELKEMRASNLISESEYEKKRAEILKDL